MIRYDMLRLGKWIRAEAFSIPFAISSFYSFASCKWKKLHTVSQQFSTPPPFLYWKRRIINIISSSSLELKSESYIEYYMRKVWKYVWEQPNGMYICTCYWFMFMFIHSVMATIEYNTKAAGAAKAIVGGEKLLLWINSNMRLYVYVNEWK